MTRRTKVLAVASTAALLAFLDATIVNVAIPDIRRSYPDSSLASLSWVLSAYNIVFAALLVAAGRLADLVGRRRMFVGGMWLFVVSSLLCAVSPSLETLVVARLLQAVAAAALVPTSVAFLLSEFPIERRATAVGIWGAAAAVAAGIGPSLGGLLIELESWRLVFLVNLPIGALAILGAARVLKEERSEAGAPLPDFLGVVVMTLAIGTLALGVVQGPEWGWSDARIVASFVAAAVLLPLLIWRCARHPSPVVELALFRIRSLSAGNLGTLLFAAAFYGTLLVNVLFLTQVWGYSVFDAGLAMSPSPLIGALVAGPSGRVADRIGQRVLAVPGCIIFAIGVWWYANRVGESPAFLGEWLPGAIMTGIGAGLVWPAFGSAAVAEVPDDRYATGSALNAMARQVGGVVGIAVVVAIIGTPAAGAGAGAEPFRDAWGFAVAGSIIAFAAAVGLGRMGPVAAPLPDAVEVTGPAGRTPA